MINVKEKVKKVVTRTTVYSALGFVAGYYVGKNYKFKVSAKKVGN